jgi:hypothetical protein
MSKKKTEKLGIEKLPLEELKVSRKPIEFDKIMKDFIKKPEKKNKEG